MMPTLAGPEPLYVPLLVHVATHAFVGFGPSVGHDLTQQVTFARTDDKEQNRATSVGAGAVAWL